jgi:hypothetical protein
VHQVSFIKAVTGFDWDIPGVPLLGGSYPPPGSAPDVTFLTDLFGDPRHPGSGCQHRRRLTPLSLVCLRGG